MDFTKNFIIFLLIVALVTYIQSKYSDLQYVTSNIDNKEHLVPNLPDKESAANLLAKVKTKLSNLCMDMTKTYPNDLRVQLLNKRFNPNNIMEKERYSNYTSYSVNKGKQIILCLRSKDEKEELIDENTLTFVAIHEIAHVMSKTIGHNDEFWNNFKFLLKEAIKRGLYNCVDYSKQPKKYCGIEVNDSPITCANILK